MISMLRGTVAHVSGVEVTLDVNGVGYQVFCSAPCVKRCIVGEQVQIVIHTEVQESLIRLYGFDDHLERQVFFLLMRVKGVGAKSASDIVSRVDKVDLLRLIAAGDLTGLQQIKGVGKKTAERIVVELRDKVGEYVIEGRGSGLIIEREVSTPFNEAAQALVALGFSRKDADRAVQIVEKDSKVIHEPGAIVREALRHV